MTIVSFHTGTCTLAEALSPSEQADLDAFYDASETLQDFWDTAPRSNWMLRVLNQQSFSIRVVPESALRLFCLKIVEPLRGRDVPALTELLALVRRRIRLDGSLSELAENRARAHDIVVQGGIQGLPRCIPGVAGALAAWHAANPDPYDAAYWTAEFVARHDAFVVINDRAARWKPHDRSLLRGGWREAQFAKAHPEVAAEALTATRTRLAHVLRSILPSPFGPGPEAVVHGVRRDTDEGVTLLCDECATKVANSFAFSLADARQYGCSACNQSFAYRAH